MEPLKRLLRSPWTLLYSAAAVLLLLHLGTGSIINSEGRWFAVAQEMMQSGDFLHPAINGQPYFDKPLVSYWLICLASFLTGGVNGWSARLPSALAGLLALFCTVRIARQLFGDRAALWSGWVLTTLYSFVYWGRSAEADMEQAAAIMAALAVYFAVREKRTLWGYMLFWSICAAGAQTKGLGAIILPVAVAGLDMLFRKEVLRHLQWRNAAGLLTGAVLYALPFLLESFSRKSYDASGIVLVFRENVVRVFNPWDHKNEPWWCYFKHLPRLLIPWVPVFTLALIHQLTGLFRDRKSVKPEMRWLLSSVGVIFLLFSASRSRRVYYILPAIPFCAILCGTYLAVLPKDWTGKLTGLLLKITAVLFVIAGFLALAAPAGLLPVICRLLFPGSGMRPFSYVHFLLTLPTIGLMLFWLMLRMRDQADVILKRVVSGFALVLLAVFTIAMPWMGNDPAFRTERTYSEFLHGLLRHVPPENIAFWGGDYSSMVYYLHLPQPAKLYSMSGSRASRNFYSDSANYLGIEEFRAFLRKAEKEGGAVLLRRDTAEIWREQAPDVWKKFFLQDGSPRPENCCEPASLVQQKFGAKKMAKIMRKKMMLRFFPVPQK